MNNFFNLMNALQTDQFDELTVKEFKEVFNTEPDVDMAHAEMFPEGRNERLGMSIMAHHIESMSKTGCVIVVGGKPGDDPFAPKPDKVFPVRDFNIEPIAQIAQIFDDQKRIREEKKQNQFRSRNYKK